MNQICILRNSYKFSHPPLVSVSSVHFMNQTERLLRKWRKYFLDLKDMRLFLAIAEENNLTRAAQKNGYTQSAASHMLRNIETELGFSLFSRSQRGLALTRNGEALLPPIRRTLAAAEYFDPWRPDRAYPDRRLSKRFRPVAAACPQKVSLRLPGYDRGSAGGMFTGD